MICHQVQANLSLYLYGELDFALEETVEAHLESCAFCQTALAREKACHSALMAAPVDASFDLLSDCRQELKKTLLAGGPWRVSWLERGRNWLESFGIVPSRWSAGMAAASLLLILGFAAGRFIHLNPADGDAAEMGLFNPATARIRGIETGTGGRVRIIVDQVHQNVVVGQMDDAAIRRLLLAATRDPDDPGVRYDSVEVLNGESGDDVRDALLFAVRHDPNAGVRLKAIEGLRRFIGNPAARDGLAYVLEHDSDPGVRSQAIDVLAPATDKLSSSPELINALENAMRSDQMDDDVRLRCFQVLSELKAGSNIY
ncbi:MAG: HEAT repeat domain-containing protein [Bryobacteraceae bacterium]